MQNVENILHFKGSFVQERNLVFTEPGALLILGYITEVYFWQALRLFLEDFSAVYDC